MNLKSILLSVAILANLVCNNIKTITQITDPYTFMEYTTLPKVAIAVGYQQDPSFTALVNQLSRVQGQFPSVRFAWAYGTDVAQACMKFNLGPLMVGAFKSGTIIDRISGPVSIASLINQLKGSLGKIPLIGN